MSGDARKTLYREHCSRETSIPLFSRDWWLDAAVGERNWDVALVEKGGQVIGSLPFQVTRKAGFRRLGQPPLTQTLGPWIRPSNAKRARALGYEKDVMDGLIAALPPFDLYAQNWHHRLTNWLPFYWHGFTQTTRYTYVIRELEDEKQVWEGVRENIRTDVRKAQGRAGLTVHFENDPEALIALNRQTYARQGKQPPYPDRLVRSLHDACSARRCCAVLTVRDGAGRPYASLLLVWDESAAYYLIGGSDPEVRNTGAMSLAVWEAIRFARTVTKSFDFEGSMMEPVERFCRAFGAEQVPYLRVSCVRSPLIAFALTFRDALRVARRKR
ncbi:MAG TPA: GNAT family N-acetyltransferase [Thermoanaerobaculia bacterium]|jgi:hypothetical protein